MSPEDFVALLARDLDVVGVVAGRNYRFGFKAKGDAAALEQLGAQYGLRVKIVDLVGPDGRPIDQGCTSSSAIREFLAAGNVDAAAEMMGRRHRVVATCQVPSRLAAPMVRATTAASGAAAVQVAAHAPHFATQVVTADPLGSTILIPETQLLNQGVKPGTYVVSLSAYAYSCDELLEVMDGCVKLAVEGASADGPRVPIHPDVSSMRFEGVPMQVRADGALVVPPDVVRAMQERQGEGRTWTVAVDF